MARALRAVPGVSAYTAGLIRMRALGDPDVLLAPAAPNAAWRPWSSYATHHLRAVARDGVGVPVA